MLKKYIIFLRISKKNITFAAAKDRMYLFFEHEIGCKGTTKNPNMQIKSF